jgi:hypothetical protein
MSWRELMPHLPKALRTLTVIVAAFVITSALMFWLPVVQRQLGYDVYDYIDTLSPGVYGDYYPASDALAKRTPSEDRVAQDQLFSELKPKQQEFLLQLEAAESDVCSDGSLDCLGLPPQKVQRVIQAVLKDRTLAREADNAQTARNADITARLSFFVAILSTIFAGLTYYKKHHSGQEKNLESVTDRKPML